MAPSVRRSALFSSTATTAKKSSTSSSRQQPTQQTQLKSALSRGVDGSDNVRSSARAGFGRVTKARGKGQLRVKFSDVEKGAFESWNVDGDKENGRADDAAKAKEDVVEVLVEDVVQVAEVKKVESTLQKRKRRYSGDESGSESDLEQIAGRYAAPTVQGREQGKKRRALGQAFHRQPLSPPASRDGTDCDEDSSMRDVVTISPRSRRVNATLPALVELPQPLLDLISMHAAFLKALSLHYAHNGALAPAELEALMQSMTHLWKKQSVRGYALRRMLALHEVAANPEPSEAKQLEQKCSPFKIVTFGLGSNVRTNVEYVSQVPYCENVLQATYSDMVHNCFKNNPSLDDSTKIPLLAIAIGTQTSLHRSKAAATRAEILGLSAAAQSRSTPDFSKLSIADPSEHTPAAVKSRTLSLFDRVRAKGLANANNVAPTTEQLTRRHALGRIGEVVEFLRMKQQQKLSSQFHSSARDSTGKVMSSGKISFSQGAVVQEIRQSVGVPIGEEEVNVCLRILSQEIPGDWCRIFQLGSVISITLQGNGMSGAEIKTYLESKSP